MSGGESEAVENITAVDRASHGVTTPSGSESEVVNGSQTAGIPDSELAHNSMLDSMGRNPLPCHCPSRCLHLIWVSKQIYLYIIFVDVRCLVCFNW